MAKKAKKVSTSKAGKLIKQAMKELKGARASASPRGKKKIDLHMKTLSRTYDSMKFDCGRSANPWIL
jgi:hypothetical protein